MKTLLIEVKDSSEKRKVREEPQPLERRRDDGEGCFVRWEKGVGRLNRRKSFGVGDRLTDGGHWMDFPKKLKGKCRCLLEAAVPFSEFSRRRPGRSLPPRLKPPR